MIICYFLISIIFVLGFVIYKLVKNSADLIQEEIDKQNETKKQIVELYLYLRELKESTIATEDVLVSEIYRNCVMLHDYFENVYFKDEEVIVNKN